MRDKNGKFIKGHHYSPSTEFKKGQHWREPKDHWNYDWLFREYITNKRSASDIAEQQGCKESNILYWLRKLDIPRRDMKTIRKIKHWGLSGETNGMYGKYGKENPRWRGGITPERQSLYSSIEWKRLAKYIRKRDKNICQRCGEKANKKGASHIHHIKNFEIKKLRLDPNNLILLCRDCHGWVHSKKNKSRRFLG